MRQNAIFFLALVLLAACQNEKIPVQETGALNPMPDTWIDQVTGYKITHLVQREGENRSFYFHNNPFLPAIEEINEKMVFYGKVDEDMQLFSVDLKTKAADQLTNKKGVSGEIVAPKAREVFYQCGDTVFATGVDNHQTRMIYVFPDTIQGKITTINADETLLAGAISSPEEGEIYRQFPEKHDYFNRIYDAKLKRTLFTINIETGELKQIYSENAWLNHIQFSPTDPKILMFCHEGPWHKVDRIWTINLEGGQPKLMHTRTIEGEIAGHEFFSRDGQRIWFDLQKPRGETFLLCGTEIATGEEINYEMNRDEWSIHFTISPDQQIFAGDGGDPSQVAKANDGMWIYLFRPEGNRLKSEKLVDMRKHGYKLEPNVHFSPDGKRIIFRANFEGQSDIYAVEIESKIN